MKSGHDRISTPRLPHELNRAKSYENRRKKERDSLRDSNESKDKLLYKYYNKAPIKPIRLFRFNKSVKNRSILPKISLKV